MKKTISTLLISALTLTSCVSEKEQVAASKTAALWGAETCTIGHTKATSTDKGTHNIIVVTLKNLKSVDEKYSKEKITSISALTTIENIEEKDYKDFDQIKIVIDDNSSIFEKTYEISKILKTKPILEKASSFFSLNTKKDTASLRNLLDKEFISDTTLYQLIGAVNELDSVYGKLNNIVFIGFSYNKMQDRNIPLSIVSSEVTNGQTTTIYTFEISEENEKIVGVSLNNE